MRLPLTHPLNSYIMQRDLRLRSCSTILKSHWGVVRMSKMGNEILASLTEALEHAQGNTKSHAIRATVEPVREAISAEEIKAVRKNLDMTQISFATLNRRF